MTADHTPPREPCRNCGSPLHGEHCHACGQPRKGLLRDVRTIAGELLDSLFDLDGRLLRTLPALLFRPGFLSRAYIDGHRIRYVSPVRLFVFLCLAAFFAARLTTPAPEIGEDGESASALESDEPGISINGQPWDPDANPVSIGIFPDAANDWLNAQIGHIPQNLERIREDPDLLINAFFSALPTALFVLVPVFALLLKLLYLFEKRLYMEHLVIALHGHAFVCAMLLLGTLAGAIEQLAGQAAWLSMPLTVLQAAATLWVPVYLWLHLKNAYHQNAWMTSLKYVLLGTVEVMLLGIVTIGALLSAIVWL